MSSNLTTPTVWLAYSVMHLTVDERNRVRVPATPNNIVPCCNDSNTDFGSVSVGLNPTGTSILAKGGAQKKSCTSLIIKSLFNILRENCYYIWDKTCP